MSEHPSDPAPAPAPRAEQLDADTRRLLVQAANDIADLGREIVAETRRARGELLQNHEVAHLHEWTGPANTVRSIQKRLGVAPDFPNSRYPNGLAPLDAPRAQGGGHAG